MFHDVAPLRFSPFLDYLVTLKSSIPNSHISVMLNRDLITLIREAIHDFIFDY
jgi:hypothetical protein